MISVAKELGVGCHSSSKNDDLGTRSPKEFLHCSIRECCPSMKDLLFEGILMVMVRKNGSIGMSLPWKGSRQKTSKAVSWMKITDIATTSVQ